jgi:hypothetical protein
MLIRIWRGRGSPKTAICSALFLCGLYFVSWYLITHWCDRPGAPIF